MNHLADWMIAIAAVGFWVNFTLGGLWVLEWLRERRIKKELRQPGGRYRVDSYNEWRRGK